MLLFGCGTPSEAPKPTTKPAAKAVAKSKPARSPAALRKAWRDSVTYRSSHLALAKNVEAMKIDIAKAERMLEKGGANKLMPIVKDASVDAAAAKKALETYVARFTPGSTVSEASTTPTPKLPGPRVTNRQGLAYTGAQALGSHKFEVRLGNAKDLKAFVNKRHSASRALFIESVDKKAGSAKVAMHYFRDLPPVTLYRPKVDVEAIIQKAGGEGNEAAKATAAKLRKNYAEVEAAQAGLDQAFRLEVEFKVRAGRMTGFRKLAMKNAKQGWSALTGAPEPKEEHPH